ncbi:MAG: HPr family phosphocarrier protein [Lachnospiraceae bacterium]
MKTFQYIITDPEGIHARPAGELVKALKDFTSAITITKDGKSADAKRIFGIMSLAAKQGQEITITADGEDEDTAIKAIEEFLKANL